MTDTHPSVEELVAAAVEGDLISYNNEYRKGIDAGKLTDLVLSNSNEPEIDFIRFFFKDDEPGYCTSEVSNDFIDEFIWRHDMEEAHQLMRIWTKMRKSGMVRLVPLEVAPGTSIVDYPAMFWELSL